MLPEDQQFLTFCVKRGGFTTATFTRSQISETSSPQPTSQSNDNTPTSDLRPETPKKLISQRPNSKLPKSTLFSKAPII